MVEVTGAAAPSGPPPVSHILQLTGRRRTVGSLTLFSRSELLSTAPTQKGNEIIHQWRRRSERLVAKLRSLAAVVGWRPGRTQNSAVAAPVVPAGSPRGGTFLFLSDEAVYADESSEVQNREESVKA